MNQKVRDLDIVFIVGFPRSGTTWVSWLMAQHPAVLSCQQGGIFHALQPLRGWWSAQGEYAKAVVGLGDGMERADMTGALGPAGPALRPLVRGVFERVAALDDDASVVVEQTPENLVQVDFISEVLPEARFLHVVRDPRSVLCSLQKAVASWADPGGFPTSPVEFSRMWCEYMERAEALDRASDRYLEVRYEDLLADGPPHLEKIWSWLGLESDPQLRAKAVENCRIDNLRQKATAPRGFFRQGTSEGWRQELAGSQLRIVEYVAGEAMAARGYQRALAVRSRPPLRMRTWDLSSRILRWTLAGPLAPVASRLLPSVRRLGRTAQGMTAGTAGVSRPDLKNPDPVGGRA